MPAQEVLDPTVGQDVVGEMRREIHRMELRHGELMRLQVRGRHFFSGRTLCCLDVDVGDGGALHGAACCRWSVLNLLDGGSPLHLLSIDLRFFLLL